MRHLITVAALVGATACAGSREPDAYGNIEATEVVVGAQADGQLVTFTPSTGDHVPEGAITAVVDTTALSLSLKQIAAQRTATASRIDEAAKQIVVIETQRAIAERNLERTRRLYDQQAATAQQLDQADRDFRTLEAQIEATRAQRRTASDQVAPTVAQAAQIRDQMHKASVANPVAGTVLATYVEAGEVVHVGQPLYKIANLDTVELRAYVTETQLGRIRLGQSATVAIDTGKARHSLPGVVSWISSQAEFTPTPIQTRDERSNLVYAIKVRLANQNGVLKIGMPADLALSTTVASR
jgi:HlyD family secretion protein